MDRARGKRASTPRGVGGLGKIRIGTTRRGSGSRGSRGMGMGTGTEQEMGMGTGTGLGK